MNTTLEIATQAESIKSTLAELDLLLDELTTRESTNLLEVYRSINIILKAQEVMLSKNGLKLIKD